MTKKKKRDTDTLKINGIRNQSNVAGKDELTFKTTSGVQFSIHLPIAIKYKIESGNLIDPEIATQAIMDDLEYQRKLQEKKDK